MTQLTLTSLYDKVRSRGGNLLAFACGLMAILVLSLWSAPAAAQNYAAPYLLHSNSAEASGFGEAFVASADDAAAVKWNPAGISGIENYNVSAVYAQGLGLGRKYSSFAGGYTVDGIGTFAVSVEQSGVNDIQRYTDQNVQQGTFSVTNYVAGLSYAREVVSGLSVGGSVNYIRQDLSVQTDNGYSLDLGARFAQENFFAGASLQSAVGEVSPDQLPKTLRLGAGVTYQGLIAEVDYGIYDVVHQSGTDDFVNIGLGYEQTIQDVVVGGRAGLRDGNLGVGGSLGVVVNDLFRFTADYAYVNEPSPIFDNSHRIGVSVSGL